MDSMIKKIEQYLSVHSGAHHEGLHSGGAPGRRLRKDEKKTKRPKYGRGAFAILCAAAMTMTTVAADLPAQAAVNRTSSYEGDAANAAYDENTGAAEGEGNASEAAGSTDADTEYGTDSGDASGNASGENTGSGENGGGDTSASGLNDAGQSANDAAQDQDSEQNTDEAASEENTEEAVSYASGTLTYGTDDDAYKVTVTFDESALLPEGTTLSAAEILADNDEDEYDYDNYLAQAQNKLNEEDEKNGADAETIDAVHFYDILFTDADGNKVEPDPNANLQVSISYKDGLEKTEEQSVQIFHFTDDNDTSTDKIDLLTSPELTGDDTNVRVDEVKFDTDKFSVYAVALTSPVKAEEDAAAEEAADGNTDGNKETDASADSSAVNTAKVAENTENGKAAEATGTGKSDEGTKTEETASAAETAAEASTSAPEAQDQEASEDQTSNLDEKAEAADAAGTAQESSAVEATETESSSEVLNEEASADSTESAAESDAQQSEDGEDSDDAENKSLLETIVDGVKDLFGFSTPSYKSISGSQIAADATYYTYFTVKKYEYGVYDKSYTGLLSVTVSGGKITGLSYSGKKSDKINPVLRSSGYLDIDASIEAVQGVSVDTTTSASLSTGGSSTVDRTAKKSYTMDLESAIISAIKGAEAASGSSSSSATATVTEGTYRGTSSNSSSSEDNRITVDVTVDSDGSITDIAIVTGTDDNGNDYTVGSWASLLETVRNEVVGQQASSDNVDAVSSATTQGWKQAIYDAIKDALGDGGTKVDTGEDSGNTSSSTYTLDQAGSIIVKKGDTVTLTCTTSTSDVTSYLSNPVSSDTSVVTVSGSGTNTKATAVGTGTATVTVSNSRTTGGSVTYTIYVIDSEYDNNVTYDYDLGDTTSGSYDSATINSSSRRVYTVSNKQFDGDVYVNTNVTVIFDNCLFNGSIYASDSSAIADLRTNGNNVFLDGNGTRLMILSSNVFGTVETNSSLPTTGSILGQDESGAIAIAFPNTTMGKTLSSSSLSKPSWATATRKTETYTYNGTNYEYTGWLITGTTPSTTGTELFNTKLTYGSHTVNVPMYLYVTDDTSTALDTKTVSVVSEAQTMSTGNGAEVTADNAMNLEKSATAKSSDADNDEWDLELIAGAKGTVSSGDDDDDSDYKLLDTSKTAGTGAYNSLSQNKGLYNLITGSNGATAETVYYSTDGGNTLYPMTASLVYSYYYNIGYTNSGSTTSLVSYGSAGSSHNLDNYLYVSKSSDYASSESGSSGGGSAVTYSSASSRTIEVGETTGITGTTAYSSSGESWKVDTGGSYVQDLSGSGSTATVTGKAVGPAKIKHSYIASFSDYMSSNYTDEYFTINVTAASGSGEGGDGEVTTACTMDSSSVLKDTISDKFNLTDKATATAVVQKYNTSTNAWEDTSTTYDATISGKVVTVASGFDYKSHPYVEGGTAEQNANAQRIKVTISGITGIQTTEAQSNVATNGTAGVYASSSASTPTYSFDSPVVNIPAAEGITVTGAVTHGTIKLTVGDTDTSGTSTIDTAKTISTSVASGGSVKVTYSGQTDYELASIYVNGVEKTADDLSTTENSDGSYSFTLSDITEDQTITVSYAASASNKKSVATKANDDGSYDLSLSMKGVSGTTTRETTAGSTTTTTTTTSYSPVDVVLLVDYSYSIVRNGATNNVTQSAIDFINDLAAMNSNSKVAVVTYGQAGFDSTHKATSHNVYTLGSGWTTAGSASTLTSALTSEKSKAGSSTYADDYDYGTNHGGAYAAAQSLINNANDSNDKYVINISDGVFDYSSSPFYDTSYSKSMKNAGVTIYYLYWAASDSDTSKMTSLAGKSGASSGSYVLNGGTGAANIGSQIAEVEKTIKTDTKTETQVSTETIQTNMSGLILQDKLSEYVDFAKGASNNYGVKVKAGTQDVDASNYTVLVNDRTIQIVFSDTFNFNDSTVYTATFPVKANAAAQAYANADTSSDSTVKVPTNEASSEGNVFYDYTIEQDGKNTDNKVLYSQDPTIPITKISSDPVNTYTITGSVTYGSMTLADGTSASITSTSDSAASKAITVDENDDVTVSYNPMNSNYELKSVKITDPDGNETDVTTNSENSYTFSKLNGNYKIDVVYGIKSNTPDQPGRTDPVDPSKEADNLNLTKTADKQGQNVGPSDTVTLTLEAGSSGSTVASEEATAADVLLVLDNTSSMQTHFPYDNNNYNNPTRLSVMQGAAENFVNNLNLAVGSNVAVVSFKSANDNYGATTSPTTTNMGWTEVTETNGVSNLSSIKSSAVSAISALTAPTGNYDVTNYLTPLNYVTNNTLTNRTNPVYVVFFTDGDDNSSNTVSDISSAAASMRAKLNGGVAYSVGLIEEVHWDDDVTTFENKAKAIATSDSYFYKVQDSTDMTTAFNNALTSITTKTKSTTLDSSAVFQDTVNMDKFDVSSATATVTVYEHSNGTWTAISGASATTGSSGTSGTLTSWTGKSTNDGNLTINFDRTTGKVTVTGFSYKDHYLVSSGTQPSDITPQILHLEISGIKLKSGAQTSSQQVDVHTNDDNNSGIYKSSSDTTPVATFPQPTVNIAGTSTVDPSTTDDYGSKLTYGDSWQMVSNRYDGNTSDKKTTSGNVAVQKNVVPTYRSDGTVVENEFLVYLGIDRIIDISSHFNKLTDNQIVFHNNTGTAGSISDTQPSSASKKGTDHTVTITIKDSSLSTDATKQALASFSIQYGDVSNGSIYCELPNGKWLTVVGQTGNGSNNHPYVTEVTIDLSTLSTANALSFYQAFFDSDEVTLNRVTDTLGTGFTYKGVYSGQYKGETKDFVDGTVTEDNGTLTWTIGNNTKSQTEYNSKTTDSEKLEALRSLIASANSNGKITFENDAELVYKVEYDPTVTNTSAVASNSRLTSISNTRANDNTAQGEADVNSSAVLNTNGGEVTFPVPEVRGMLYDINLNKIDQYSDVVPNAEFKIEKTSGWKQSIFKMDNVKSDSNGNIAFNGLTYGTYKVTEVSPAPNGYSMSNDENDYTFTFTIPENAPTDGSFTLKIDPAVMKSGTTDTLNGNDLVNTVSGGYDSKGTNAVNQKNEDTPLTGMIYGKDGRAILLAVIGLVALGSAGYWMRRRRKKG